MYTNYNTYEEDIQFSNSFIRRAFTYMTLGILTTIATGYYLVYFNQALLMVAIRSFGLIALLQLALVLVLGFKINTLSNTATKAIFFGYSVLCGVTFSTVALIYQPRAVILSLMVTCAIFGVMTVYGYVTREDLSGYGKYLRGGIWALIIVSIVNIFMRASAMDYFITIAGTVIFTVLIAYDVNRIKATSYVLRHQDDETVDKLGIYMALVLYLDFINLFLYVVRLLGNKRK